MAAGNRALDTGMNLRVLIVLESGIPKVADICSRNVLGQGADFLFATQPEIL